jgi:hypothetical protein
LGKEEEEYLDHIGNQYLREVAGQTRGSHRIKRANTLGSSVVPLINLMAGTISERSVVGYIERAQLRTKLAIKKPRRDFVRGERIYLADLLLERLVLDKVLKLDEMESLEAINRLRRCARCGSWFWSRVMNQRYCSEDCRVRHYHASPAGKKYKREWARKDYQHRKQRDEAVRQLALNSIHSRRPTKQLITRSSPHSP